MLRLGGHAEPARYLLDFDAAIFATVIGDQLFDDSTHAKPDARIFRIHRLAGATLAQILRWCRDTSLLWLRLRLRVRFGDVRYFRRCILRSFVGFRYGGAVPGLHSS